MLYASVELFGRILGIDHRADGKLPRSTDARFQYRDGHSALTEPHASITGIWEFDDAVRLTTIAGTVTSAHYLRAKVEGGVLL